MNLERSRQELKASTLTAQQQTQLFWAEILLDALKPELARATSTDDSVPEVEDLEKLGQPQQNWNEGGNTDKDNDFDFDDNMETANSDSDDSVSEVEDLEKLGQPQQNF